jgi:hypothetical protein
MNGSDGAAGADGQDGETGPQGDPGPNEVSTTTDTDISGILKGNGSKVAVAQAGTDYATPNNVSNAVSVHNSASNAHSGLFAGKMSRKIPIGYITESTVLSTEHAEAFTLANSTAAITLTVPSGSTIPVGTMINITNINTGAVSFAAANGVTLHTKDGKVSIDGQYAAVTLLKASDTVWYAWGALA